MFTQCLLRDRIIVATMAVLPRTLLDELRSRSQVDCDTLDYKGEQPISVLAEDTSSDTIPVAETLGPFVDHTSNQVSHVQHSQSLTFAHCDTIGYRIWRITETRERDHHH